MKYKNISQINPVTQFVYLTTDLEPVLVEINLRTYLRKNLPKTLISIATVPNLKYTNLFEIISNHNYSPIISST